METPKPNELESILNLSREMAAGGECSLRTLQLINCVSSRESTRYSPAELVDENQVSSEAIISELMWHNSFFDGDKSGRLVRLHLPADNKEEVRLGYHIIDTNKVIELWHFVERSSAEVADSPLGSDCSYAVFMPAFNEATDIDFSMVVTKVDEDMPSSSDESLKETPVTNKVVLDVLLEILKNGRNDLMGELSDRINLPQIIKQYGLDEESSMTIKAQHELADRAEPINAAHRALFRVAKLRSLDKKPEKYQVEHGGVSLHIDYGAADTATISVEHKDLGLHGRKVSMGTVKITEEALIGVRGSEASDIPVKLAEAAMGLPEVGVSKELQQELQDLINSETSWATFVNESTKVIQKYSQNKIRDVVMDLGTLDLRKFTDASDSKHSVFHGSSKLKAKILLPEGGKAFAGGVDLYECEVFGGQVAFNKASRAVSCATFDTTFAFQETNDTTINCLAVGGQMAFTQSHKQSYGDYINAIAVDTNEAFTKSTCKNCVTIGCKDNFINATTENCLVQDPKLLGRSFVRDNEMSYRRNGNKIKGRLIGSWRRRQG